MFWRLPFALEREALVLTCVCVVGAAGLAAVIATAHHIVWYTYNFFAQHWGMIGMASLLVLLS